MTRAHVALLLVGLAAGAAGCEDSIPGSVLAGPRVIAVIADPPVIAPDMTAALGVVVAIDGTPVPPAATRWRVCAPSAVIVDPVRDCVGDRALVLPTGGDGGTGLDAAAVLAWSGVVLPDAGDDPCGRAILPVVVVVEAELAGARLVATKQVWIGLAPPPRSNPQIADVVVDGVAVIDPVVARGASLEATAVLALAALDRVCGDIDDPVELESVQVSVFVGGGGTVSPGTFGVDHAADGVPTAGSVEIVAPDEPGAFPLWMIAVDPDGGVGVAHRRLTVD